MAQWVRRPPPRSGPWAPRSLCLPANGSPSSLAFRHPTALLVVACLPGAPLSFHSPALLPSGLYRSLFSRAAFLSRRPCLSLMAQLCVSSSRSSHPLLPRKTRFIGPFAPRLGPPRLMGSFQPLTFASPYHHRTLPPARPLPASALVRLPLVWVHRVLRRGAQVIVAASQWRPTSPTPRSRQACPSVPLLRPGPCRRLAAGLSPAVAA